MNTRKAGSVWLVSIVALAALATACAKDPSITTKIKTKMAADDLVKAYQVNVTTDNGVVTLTGNIDSMAAKERAIAIAKETAGVVRVQDMLSAKREGGGGNAPEPSRTAGQRVDDAAITMRVKGRLLDDPLVKGLKIDVDTRQGVVYLTGKVRSNQEKERAIELAQGAEDVQRVEANLTLEGS